MSENHNTVPVNTIQACVVPGVTEDVASYIQPCQPTREWMDKVPQKYIYRCIPMIAANTMGWELLNPTTATAVWNGGELNTDVTISQKETSRFGAGSHFGSSIVTWYVPFLFRTPPDLGLMVTGPANHEHDKATPLDAFIRTDWLPFPFTMNWRLTQKNVPVTFEKGVSIARIYPFPIALLEQTSLEICDLEDDPEFLSEVQAWGKIRQQNSAKQRKDVENWLEGGEKPKGEGVWNSQYVRAKARSEDGYLPHQTVFRCSDPKDKRAK